MKLSLNRGLILGMIVLPLLNSSVGLATPKELVHLKDLLTEAQLTSGKALDITAESVRMEGEDRFRAHGVLMDALEQSKAAGQEIKTVEFVSWNDNSRKELLSRIFSKRDTAPRFCSSLKLPQEATPTTPGSRPKDPERGRISACRKAMDGVLGGIMHASPQVMLVELGSQGPESELNFYVQSVTDGAEYLHYKVSL